MSKPLLRSQTIQGLGLIAPAWIVSLGGAFTGIGEVLNTVGNEGFLPGILKLVEITIPLLASLGLPIAFFGRLSATEPIKGIIKNPSQPS